MRQLQADALLSAIGAVRGCERTKRQVVDVIVGFAGTRIFVPFALVRDRRIDQAAMMLRTGMRRVDAARALCARFGVSESTAYRLIREGLDRNRPGRRDHGRG